MNYLKSIKLWKWLLLLIGGLLLFIVLYALATGLPASLLPEGWVRAVVYVLESVTLLAIYYLCVRLIEKRQADDLILKRLPAKIGLGFLCGGAIMVITVLIFALCGFYKINSVQFDAKQMLFAFCSFLPVAVGEEIFSRGILFRFIDSRWNLIAAIIVSALVFGLLHLPNPGASLWNSIAVGLEAGVLLAVAYKFSGSLYFPIGIHWGWNFVQGNILGCAVSGGDAGYSLITAEISGPAILSGGAFGPEASIITVLLTLGVSAYFVVKFIKKNLDATK